MKKSILLLIMLLVSLVTISQTNFDKGFVEGYKNGYCFNIGNCITPQIPVTPLPNYYENSNSYTDGYNRGFKMGQDKQTSENSEVKNSNSGNYKTAKPEFVNFVNTESTSDKNKSNIISMKERYDEMKGHYEIVINAINDDSKILNNKIKYYEIRDKFNIKINQLMKTFNFNKISILQNEKEFYNHYWELVTIISDFNEEIKQNGL